MLIITHDTCNIPNSDNIFLHQDFNFFLCLDSQQSFKNIYTRGKLSVQSNKKVDLVHVSTLNMFQMFLFFYISPFTLVFLLK